jgi:hypothetical protein
VVRRAGPGWLGSGGRARGSGRAGPGAASGGSARVQERGGACAGPDQARGNGRLAVPSGSGARTHRGARERKLERDTGDGRSWASASVRRMAAGRRWCAAREQTRREREQVMWLGCARQQEAWRCTGESACARASEGACRAGSGRELVSGTAGSAGANVSDAERVARTYAR